MAEHELLLVHQNGAAVQLPDERFESTRGQHVGVQENESACSGHVARSSSSFCRIENGSPAPCVQPADVQIFDLDARAEPDVALWTIGRDDQSRGSGACASSDTSSITLCRYTAGEPPYAASRSGWRLSRAAVIRDEHQLRRGIARACFAASHRTWDAVR